MDKTEIIIAALLVLGMGIMFILRDKGNGKDQ